MEVEGKDLEKKLKDERTPEYVPPDITSESEENSEDEDVVMELPPIKKITGQIPKHIQGRNSISGDKYNAEDSQNFKPKKVYKSQDQKEFIRDLLKNIFIFSSLDEEQFEAVIEAIEVKTVYKNDTVIQQGDEGNSLYIVGSGSLECRKIIKNVDTFLLNYEKGGLFGELALLYNCPRAATIKAKERSKLFVLDRETFNHLVKGQAIQKRTKLDNFLKRVPILEPLNDYDRSLVVDCLQITKFKPGQEIIHQVTKIFNLRENLVMIYILFIKEGSRLSNLILMGRKRRFMIIMKAGTLVNSHS